MKINKLKDGIYWVGGIDWNLRNFHGYVTQKGSTYNSYLIVDKKIVLIDNVKDYLFQEQLNRISEVIDPAKIDIIIQNHVEMDHSGSLPQIKKICPDAQIYASPQGARGIEKHFKKGWIINSVRSGDTINVGERNLHFVQTPMVHWPDNMVTYCPEDKILFSNDAFGQHIASSERIDSEFPYDILVREAKKYYANIVLPFGQQVKKALNAINKLEIDLICPSHGLCWQTKISNIIKEYTQWSANRTKVEAVIVYDTMWKSTEKIAYMIQQAFEENNIKTSLFNLQYNHISDIMTDVLTAKYLCVGSPTLNNNILPTVSAFLTYLKGLAPKNRIGLAFGSYGWSGQSVAIVDELLKECKFRNLDKIKIQYIPDTEILNTEKSKLEEQIKQE